MSRATCSRYVHIKIPSWVGECVARSFLRAPLHGHAAQHIWHSQDGWLAMCSNSSMDPSPFAAIEGGDGLTSIAGRLAATAGPHFTPRHDGSSCVVAHCHQT